MFSSKKTEAKVLCDDFLIDYFKKLNALYFSVEYIELYISLENNTEYYYSIIFITEQYRT